MFGGQACADLNGDGIIGMADTLLVLQYFGGPPGPSCCGMCAVD